MKGVKWGLAVEGVIPGALDVWLVIWREGNALSKRGTAGTSQSRLI